MFCCRLLTFFKINFFKKIFQEHYLYQSVKLFGSRSEPTFCPSLSASKQFAKIISRRLKSLLAGKELMIISVFQLVVTLDQNQCKLKVKLFKTVLLFYSVKVTLVSILSQYNNKIFTVDIYKIRKQYFCIQNKNYCANKQLNISACAFENADRSHCFLYTGNTL